MSTTWKGWKGSVKTTTDGDLHSPPQIPSDGKIGGAAVGVGDRVLVKDQFDQTENGIYAVKTNPPDPTLLLARPGGREPFFNVLDFGADPDGELDSWQAFKDWSIAITNAGGGIGLVPVGTYKIDRTDDENGTRSFRFEECNGLWLIGYGVTINLKGDVHLNYDADNGSDKHMVAPFFVRQCRNVCIEGFEIDGNVDELLSRDPRVIEPGWHCVNIVSSHHVTIRNVRIHHGWTDGISIRAKDYLVPDSRWYACRTVVIENCDVYSNFRCNIGVQESRHLRISGCRIHDAGAPGINDSGMGVDIEPDLWIGIEHPDPEVVEYEKDIEPPGLSRFTIIENCEFYNNYKQIAVAAKYSHVIVRECFIDNQRDNPNVVILSVPHCTLLDSELDAGTGHINIAISGSLIGRNVFTMERCLVRSRTAIVNGDLKTGQGLSIAATDYVEVGRHPVPRVAQALVANNRFMNESKQPWFRTEDGTPVDSGARFPNLSHGNSALQITFRDNYVFIPKEAYAGTPLRPMPAVALHVQLAENNVYETDFEGGGDYFEVLYNSDVQTPPGFGVLVRNERFIAAGDGSGIRPGDDTGHDNRFPYCQGVIAGGTESDPGGKRVFFAAGIPAAGVFQRGDVIFKSNPSAGDSMGWVCTKAGEAGSAVDPAVFSLMPTLV